jgi:hypothetical protein
MDLKWFCICGYVLLLVVTGYLLPFIKKQNITRSSAWFIAVTTVLVSAMATRDETPLVRMLTIVFLQMLSMKIVVAMEAYPEANRLTPVQWIAFSLGWFGMRPALFEKLASSPIPFRHLIVKALSRIFIGFFCLYLSVIAEKYAQAARFFLPQALVLIGLSLILHFGILNLTTAAWRAFGVDAPELFRSPYKSTSLKEFWGRRWNIAFSEMTASIAYRPLKRKVGIQTAVILSFLLSGLLHEIAISFPVEAGYGLPMTYFAIHAGAMQLESRSSVVQRIIRHEVLGHFWVITLLIAPMPLLFHSDFIQDVLIPLRTFLLESVGFCCGP